LETVRASDSDACRRFSVAGGKTGLKIRCRSGLQFGLIVLDDEQIIAAAIDDLLTQLALAKHGVARDHPAFQDDGLQDVHGRFGFVGRWRRRLLTENASANRESR